ncbi:hypothetical protein [Micromonospora sp. IBSANI012]|uniref:hypothetical protein n=1 Tax=Micromonospora sp. IBSANI012 TaxID=3457761 RepID=UPI0040597257
MISQGAELVLPCPVCGTAVPQDVAERLVQNRLQWTVSVECPACGSATEEVGWDESPEVIREALRDAHGWSRIRLPSSAASPAVIMKAIRQGQQQVTLADARECARKLLAGEFCGTRGEMELLAERLRDMGVAADVSRLPAAGARCSAG